MFCRMQSFLHEYWHIVGYPNLVCKLTKKFQALMDSTPKFASCSSFTDAGFRTFGQHWQKFGRLPNFWHLLKQYLNLLGLTNLGTNCEDVVCKYEQVRDLKLQFHFAFCILHFASCKLHSSKFAGGKKHTFPNAFTKSSCNCDMSVCKSEIRVHLQYWIYICNQRWHEACNCKGFGSEHLRAQRLP